MTGHKDGHELVEEGLAGRVVREESVSVDKVKLTLARVREAKYE